MSARMSGPSIVVCSIGINSRSTKSATVFFNILRFFRQIEIHVSDHRAGAQLADAAIAS